MDRVEIYNGKPATINGHIIYYINGRPAMAGGELLKIYEGGPCMLGNTYLSLSKAAYDAFSKDWDQTPQIKRSPPILDVRQTSPTTKPSEPCLSSISSNRSPPLKMNPPQLPTLTELRPLTVDRSPPLKMNPPQLPTLTELRPLTADINPHYSEYYSNRKIGSI